MDAVRRVNLEAFGGADEADLVDALRSGGYSLISLVAIIDDDIVGHIMQSRIEILDGAGGAHAALSLAPVAVAPTMQRNGIGSALINESLDRARALGETVDLVLGEPTYYSRFGFSSELGALLETPYPGEAFQALEFEPGILENLKGGRVVYSPPFGALQ